MQVIYDPTTAAQLFQDDKWFKAQASNPNSGCVVINFNDNGDVGVRDSKLGDASPTLVFNYVEWTNFDKGMAAREFIHPFDRK